jgi:hypothetical protein
MAGRSGLDLDGQMDPEKVQTMVAQKEPGKGHSIEPKKVVQKGLSTGFQMGLR